MLMPSCVYAINKAFLQKQNSQRDTLFSKGNSDMAMQLELAAVSVQFKSVQILIIDTYCYRHKLSCESGKSYGFYLWQSDALRYPNLLGAAKSCLFAVQLISRISLGSAILKRLPVSLQHAQSSFQ